MRRTTLTLTAAEALALHHDTPNPSGPAWGVKTLHAEPARLPAGCWGEYALHFGRLIERKGGCYIHSSARPAFRPEQRLSVVEPHLQGSGEPAARVLEREWRSGEQLELPATRRSPAPARLTVYVRDVELIRLLDLTDGQALMAGVRAVPGGFTLLPDALPATSPRAAFLDHWRAQHGEEGENPLVWLLTLDPPTVRRDPVGARRERAQLTAALKRAEGNLARLEDRERQASQRKWQQREAVATLRLRLARHAEVHPDVRG